MQNISLCHLKLSPQDMVANRCSPHAPHSIQVTFSLAHLTCTGLHQHVVGTQNRNLEYNNTPLTNVLKAASIVYFTRNQEEKSKCEDRWQANQ